MCDNCIKYIEELPEGVIESFVKHKEELMNIFTKISEEIGSKMIMFCTDEDPEVKRTEDQLTPEMHERRKIVIGAFITGCLINNAPAENESITAQMMHEYMLEGFTTGHALSYIAKLTSH